MGIEFNCPNCNEHLRVADAHAGKIARCPQCQTETPVPWASTARPKDRTLTSDEPDRAFDPFGSFSTPSPSPSKPDSDPLGFPAAPQPDGARPLSFGKFPKESRAQAVMVLAVMSYASCFFCPGIGLVMSCAAWAMAQQELTDMQSGLVDPQGEGLVQMGRAIAIVYLVLWALILALAIAFVVLAVSMDGAK